MHNNYYFLKQLSKAIGVSFHDTVISECFSQNKNELILRFEKGRESQYIRASVDPGFSCLSFPREFHRARKNSVDLFSEIIGYRVKGIRQFKNERSFALELTEGMSILFKMHGNRSNILVYRNGVATNLFNQSIETDLEINLDSLDREIDFGRIAFEREIKNLPHLYFTFGKQVWRYLQQHGFENLPLEDQWKSIQQVMTLLNDPEFFIADVDHTTVLSLLPQGNIIERLKDPIEAVNSFYYTFIESVSFKREWERMRAVITGDLNSGKQFLEKTEAKLKELQKDVSYKTWADLIMANLHAIPAGSSKVILGDFVTGQPVSIKLKPELSPQKTAESYYRKSKNQHIEIAHIEKRVDEKKKELRTLEENLLRLESITNLRELRKSLGSQNEDKKKTTDPLPYHEHEYKGYKILVGKNANHNDTLTFRHTYKDDLWLHAKDVAGSHVVIKHQSGKPFPKDVIERAAQLAAFHSKRKNDSLTPVSVTPKKYVRKRKGDPPGAVVVEREDVVMVVPTR